MTFYIFGGAFRSFEIMGTDWNGGFWVTFSNFKNVI